MIVSDARKFIYVRIPKTGSTSVSAALEPLRRPGDRSLIGKCARRLFPRAGHPMLTDFRAHSHWGLEAAREVLGPDRFSAMFCFSVVRHPYARTRSLFDHVLRHRDDQRFQQVYGAVYRSITSLDGFVELLPTLRIPPQCSLLIAYDGSLLANTVARVENLDVEIEPIFRALGVQTSVPQLNVTPDAPSWELSQASKNILHRLYQVDFRLFGYSDDVSVVGSCDLSPDKTTRTLGEILYEQGARRFSPWESMPREW
ncbi:sulfotransferase family 2 domain-containing protein [Tsuneonella deserti]|uniref:sulfotransferase family 2 domain-containing protein n=1 Tax=Tsuneonella deserti TaxID=2035528 RepID=UPI001667C3ED|nr:sulfotransferase family 2 domain-containing protein [Tsuneonella deserti]